MGKTVGTETRIVFQNSSVTALGAIRLAGFIRGSRGKGQGRQRRLGSYALVYSLAGRCAYWDERIGTRRVHPGDLFLLFPDIAHRYGGGAHESWDEFFIVFDGPLFDLWRQRGLLDPRRAFFRLTPVSYWLRRLEACLETGGLLGWSAALRQICSLQSVLSDLLAAQASESREGAGHAAWLGRACRLLAEAPARHIPLRGLASQLGLSVETFRKEFRRAMGMSPMRYRAARTIDRACDLLVNARLSGKEIGAMLGFSDEYHFSRRFKQITGRSPTAFRRQTATRSSFAAASPHGSMPIANRGRSGVSATRESQTPGTGPGGVTLWES